MKKDMPLEGLRWSRDSGSALYDTPQTAVLGRAGGVKRVINFDVLRQLLGDNAVEDAPEAYLFNLKGENHVFPQLIMELWEQAIVTK